MLRKWNRVLSFLLSVALVTTTFGSDFATARVYAEEIEAATEDSDEGDGLGSLSIAENVEENDASEDSSEAAEEDSEEESAEDAAAVDAATEAAAEDNAEAATECTTEAAAEAATDENAEATAEVPAEAAEAVTTAETEIAVEAEAEKKLVTVTYKTQKGGTLSRKSETVDVNDEAASFEGATVTAWNDEYEFTGWVDAQGTVVEEGNTIVPSGLTEDATFTATFKANEDVEVRMPSIVKENVHAGGMIVSVNAESGVFPEGTTVSIKGISEDKALETAKDELGDGVTEAKGVDITFWNNNEEIQPADQTYVHVTLALEEAMETDNLTVLHDHGDNVEEISAAVSKDAAGNAEAVEFDVEQFSIFIVANDGSSSDDINGEYHSVATYNFYDGDKLINTQLVKKGDTLVDPGVPDLSYGAGEKGRKEFEGWYTKTADDKFDKQVTFGTVGDVTANDIVNVYAKIRVTYYITFRGMGVNGDGVDREIVHVQRAAINEGESTMVALDDETVTPKSDVQAFMGWSISEGSTTSADKVTEVDVSQVDEVYPIVVNAHWITFDKNGKGATYTAPVFVEYGKKPSASKPDDPIRSGYEFLGWFTEAEGGAEFDWNSALSSDVKVYAHWKENDSIKYTVIVWKQQVSDSVEASDADKKYDFGASKEFTISSDATLTESIIAGNVETIKNSTANFSLDHFTKNVSKSDKNVDLDIAGNSVVNVYYDRDEITVKFVTVTKRNNKIVQNTYKVVTGLYEQNFSQVKDAEWPTEYEWYDELKEDGTVAGTHYTFLASFLYDTTLYAVTPEYTPYYTKIDNIGNVLVQYDTEHPHSIYHYKENVDHTYNPENPDNTNTYPARYYKYGKNNSKTGYVDAYFYFSDKYEGFTVYEYYVGTSYPTDESAWKKVADADVYQGNPIVVYGENNNLYIRHKRNAGNITFVENYKGSTTEVGSIKGILFEETLGAYSDKTPEVNTSNKNGFTFEGWYKDKNGTAKFDWDSETMPPNNFVLYGYWKPILYTVILHEGEGAKVEKPDGMKFTLKYIEELGQFETVERGSLDANVSHGDWQLVGWFVQGTNTPYSYGQPTGSETEIHLEAKWRYPGVVKVKYDAGEFGTDAPFDNYSYATSSSVVVGQPARPDSKHVFMGWVVEGGDGAVLLPNNTFKITGDILQDYTETDGSTVKAVVLKAKYEKSEIVNEETHITYDPGRGDAGQAQITVSTPSPLPVNYKVTALGKTYTKAGYKQVSWNTEIDGKGLTVDLNKTFIAADNKDAGTFNPKANILYAQYEPITVTVTVKGLDDTSKTYNGLTQTYNEWEIVSAVDEDKEAVSVTKNDITYTGSGASGINVGTYPMNLADSQFSYTGSAFDPKAVTFVLKKDGSMKIDYAEVKVTALDNDKTYGEADPELKAEVSELVNGESEDLISYDVNRDPGEDVGSDYRIIPSGDEIQGNYKVTYQNGKFEIRKAGTNSVTVTDYNGVYDGGFHTITAAAKVTAGTTLYFSESENGEWKTSAPEYKDVTNGTTVYVKAVNPNYEDATASGKVTITPKPVTVYVDEKEKFYGEDDPELTVQDLTEQMVEGEDPKQLISYTLDRQDGEDVGDYLIDATIENEIQGNYKVSKVPNYLHIHKAGKEFNEITVTDYNAPYDADAHSITAKAKVEGSTLKYSLDGENWSDTLPTYTNVTKEPVTIHVMAEHKNYETAKATGTVTITPLKIEITAPEKEFEYSGNPWKVTADDITEDYLDKLVGEDKISKSDIKFVDETNIRTLPGDQKVIIDKASVVVKSGTETVTDNYDITVKPGKITITDRKTPYEVRLTSKDVESVYNGKEQKYTIGADVVQDTNGVAGTIQKLKEMIGNFFTITAGAAEGISFKVEGSDAEYIMSGISVTAKGTNIAEHTYKFALDSNPVIYQDGVDVTKQFKINSDQLGYLNIVPAEVTVSAETGRYKMSGTRDPEFDADVVVTDTRLDEETRKALLPEALKTVVYKVVRTDKSERAGKYVLKVDTDTKNPQGNFIVRTNDGNFTIRNRTIPDDPTPTDPTPTPDGGDTPTTPSGAVLGARREEAEEPAVLGARRGRTEDETNSSARVFAILISAAAAITIMLTGKKKEEEE